jgi:hypothetical protein
VNKATKSRSGEAPTGGAAPTSPAESAPAKTAGAWYNFLELIFIICWLANVPATVLSGIIVASSDSDVAAIWTWQTGCTDARLPQGAWGFGTTLNAVCYPAPYSTWFPSDDMNCYSCTCAVLPCPVLSCPVLSCPVLSCPVLSCPRAILCAPVCCPTRFLVVLSEVLLLAVLFLFCNVVGS